MPNYFPHPLNTVFIRPIVIMLMTLLIGACNETPPASIAENPYRGSEQTPTTFQPQTQATPEPQIIEKSPLEFFTSLNGAFNNEYCGIWQLYKRKPYNEAERLISENSYLDLKSDYTYDSNGGWIISGSGQWLPTYNYANTGTQLSYVLFKNTKYDRTKLTTVRVEMIEENGTKMLKVCDLDELSFDYYIKK